MEGQKVAIFRPTAANFRQRTLWVLKISKWGIFITKFCILDDNFPTRRQFPSIKTMGKIGRNRFFMKLFNTNVMNTVKICHGLNAILICPAALSRNGEIHLYSLLR